MPSEGGVGELEAMSGSWRLVQIPHELQDLPKSSQTAAELAHWNSA